MPHLPAGGQSCGEELTALGLNLPGCAGEARPRADRSSSSPTGFAATSCATTWPTTSASRERARRRGLPRPEAYEPRAVRLDGRPDRRGLLAVYQVASWPSGPSARIASSSASAPRASSSPATWTACTAACSPANCSRSSSRQQRRRTWARPARAPSSPGVFGRDPKAGGARPAAERRPTRRRPPGVALRSRLPRPPAPPSPARWRASTAR